MDEEEAYETSIHRLVKLGFSVRTELRNASRAVIVLLGFIFIALLGNIFVQIL